MSYAGGTNPDFELPAVRDIYAFLRAAMRQVTRHSPYRGLDGYTEKDFAYQDMSHGGIHGFWGDEHITHQSREVYHLHYSGGFLR